MPLPPRPRSPAEQPMVAERLLRLAIVGAIETANVVNNLRWDIQSPGVWATPPEKLPAIRIRATSNGKAQWTPGQPSFSTSVVIEVEGKTSAANEQMALDQTERMAYIVENAILDDYSVNLAAERFVSIDRAMEVTAEGRELHGAFKMVFTIQVPEVWPRPNPDIPETPWPVRSTPTVPLETVRLEVDATNVVDLTGTYTNDDFPTSATPAPRTIGPDGRIEVGAEITLPQP